MDGHPLPPRPDATLPASPQATWTPPAPPQPAPRYASFWIRVGAILIYGLVFIPICIPFLSGLWNRMSTEIDRSIATGQRVDVTRYMGRYAGWALGVARRDVRVPGPAGALLRGDAREAGGRDQGS